MLAGYRVLSLPLHDDGRPIARWSCYRCGQRVDGAEQNVVHGAPCVDCREYLRIEEGDQTVWDIRRLREMGLLPPPKRRRRRRAA